MVRPLYWSTWLHLITGRLPIAAGPETIKEIYEHKEREQLEKCRQLQLSNLALTLVFYVLGQTGGVHALLPNDYSANLLTKLYSVDPGSLKKNLELINGNTVERKSLTERKRTEILNRFREAHDFFEELSFPEGTRILEQLEMKFAGQEAGSVALDTEKAAFKSIFRAAFSFFRNNDQ